MSADLPASALSEKDYARIYEHEYDIDGAPWGMLNVVLADRDRG